jgi:cytochrome c
MPARTARAARAATTSSTSAGPGYYGWPLFVGDNFESYATYDWDTKKIGARFDPQHPINDSPRNTGIKELPPAQPAWISTTPTRFRTSSPSSAAAAAAPCPARSTTAIPSRPRPQASPATTTTPWFIYEWMRSWIKAIKLDEHGNKTSIEDFMPSAKLAKPMDMKFGARWRLYLLEYGSNWYHNTDATLSKITFAAGNRAPIAMATADHTAGKEPLTVKFSSAGSYDKDEGDVITFAWSFTGEASQTTSPTPPSPSPSRGSTRPSSRSPTRAARPG